MKTQNEVLTIIKNHRDAVNSMLDQAADATLLISKLSGEHYKQAMKAVTFMAETIEKSSDELVTMGIGLSTMRKELEENGELKDE